MSATKLCPRCMETKPVTAFSRDRSRKDGLHRFCKGCRKGQDAARYTNRKANGLCRCDEPAVEGKTHCQKCLDERKTADLLKRFGLTLAQYKEMLAAQGFACKICRKTEPGRQGRWCVDHDHGCCPGRKSCGKCVRGLLCHDCNTGLGLFNDNPAALAAAIEYLASFATTDNEEALR